MTNHRLFLWIGGALIILPFLGIPESWKHLIIFIIALALIAIALIIRSSEQEQRSHSHEPVFEEASGNHEHAYVSAHEHVDAADAPAGAYANEQRADDVYADEPMYETRVFEETVSYDASETADSAQYVAGAVVVEDVIAPKPKKPRKKRVTKKPEETFEEVGNADVSESFDEYAR